MEFKPISAQRLRALLKRTITAWLARLFAALLRLVKTSSLTPEGLRRKAAGNSRTERLIELFVDVWSGYEEWLVRREEIDFDDMISKAVHAISTRQWRSPFRYVLVDEFQDISTGRMKLLSALKSEGVAYFLVGDDWQSIYRFTGSNVGLMRRCDKHLGYAQPRTLTRTFRYAEPLIAPSSRFIQENPEQTQRMLQAAEGLTSDGLYIVSTLDQPAGVQHAVSDIYSRRIDDGKPSIFILGRYNHSLQEVQKKAPELKRYVEFSTVHRAKGREADYVIVLDLKDERYGFPSQILDDPLLSLVLEEPNSFPHAEERRLFYVAITRARKGVYLIEDAAHPSEFVTELRRQNPEIHTLNLLDGGAAPVCPRCSDGGLVVSQSARTRRCTNQPFCSYQAPRCDQCGNGYWIARYGRAACSNDECDVEVEACPSCGVGMLLLRDGPHSSFWGCSEYSRSEPPCTYRRNHT